MKGIPMRYNTSKRLTAIVLTFATVAIFAMSFFSTAGCSSEPEPVNFGALPSGSAALVYIAQEKGYFEAEGLVVTVKDYPTGVATTDALLRGEVDIAWAAEFPMLAKAFAGKEISIFAVSSRFSDQHLFGRKDRGINALADLKGKTVGIPVKTIAEFYLARWLTLNGMDIQDVSLVNVLPPQSVEAITSGTVDGVVTWQPFTEQIREQFGDGVTDWPIQSSQAGFGINIARNEWLNGRPELAHRFLKGLVRAEEYLVREPEAVRDIVQARLNFDDALMEKSWSASQFSVTLDQSLIIAMEDEARWMIASGLTTETRVPDFLDYIYEDALKAVKPEAVDIIR
jgi:NitT/TauT family transport system substrate-binding protein